MRVSAHALARLWACTQKTEPCNIGVGGKWGLRSPRGIVSGRHGSQPLRGGGHGTRRSGKMCLKRHPTVLCLALARPLLVVAHLRLELGCILFFATASLALGVLWIACRLHRWVVDTAMGVGIYHWPPSAMRLGQRRCGSGNHPLVVHATPSLPTALLAILAMHVLLPLPGGNLSRQRIRTICVELGLFLLQTFHWPLLLLESNVISRRIASRSPRRRSCRRTPSILKLLSLHVPFAKRRPDVRSRAGTILVLLRTHCQAHLPRHSRQSYGPGGHGRQDGRIKVRLGAGRRGRSTRKDRDRLGRPLGLDHARLRRLAAGGRRGKRVGGRRGGSPASRVDEDW